MAVVPSSTGVLIRSGIGVGNHSDTAPLRTDRSPPSLVGGTPAYDDGRAEVVTLVLLRGGPVPTDCACTAGGIGEGKTWSLAEPAPDGDSPACWTQGADEAAENCVVILFALGGTAQLMCEFV